MQSKNQNIGTRYHGSTFYQPKDVNFVANQFSIGINNQSKNETLIEKHRGDQSNESNGIEIPEAGLPDDLPF